MLTYEGRKASMGKPILWGLASGLACFVGLGSFLGLMSEPVSLIFQTLSIAPQPLCTVYVGKGCNVSRIGCNFHVSTRGWIS